MTPTSRPTRSPRARVLLFTAVFASGLALFLGLRYGLQRDARPVPDPDRSAMEPQVAAKIAEARRAVLTATVSHEAWGRLGIVLQAHRLAKDAALCYRSAAQLAPSEFRWHYLLAHALRDADVEGALTEAEIASRLKPDYSPTYVLRGQLLETTNQPDQALDQYRKASKLDETSAIAEFGLGRLHLARGELQEAIGHLLRARDLSEEAPAIHGALAQAYRRLGDLEAAQRENRLASQLTETIAINDPVHYSMRSESVSSTALLERAIEADQAQDFGKAESLYRDLVRLRPEDANIRTRFGDTLARQSKLQPAKEQYLAALAVNAELASAHYGLGNMLNFEADYQGAEEHYRRAFEARPEHVPTLVNLGSLLAFKGKSAEAASFFRKALEIDPKRFEANSGLGQLLFRQNRYKEAIPYLRAAVEARPASGRSHLQLGLALAATGEFRGAWQHVEKAQELGENVPPPVIDELRRRVGSE